ncbi:MAG: spore cortex biosynthesis protein YabQ [Eubacteriales bacterium]
MSMEIQQEIHFLMSTVLLGTILTFLYDWLRILRQAIKHRQLWVSLEDFLYWCVSFCLSFQLLYKENNGVIRWFSIVGAAIGMILYKLTISPYFVKSGTRLLQAVVHMCYVGVRTLGHPIYQKMIIARQKTAKGKYFLKKKREIVQKKLTRRIKMIKLVLKNH